MALLGPLSSGRTFDSRARANLARTPSALWTRCGVTCEAQVELGSCDKNPEKAS